MSTKKIASIHYTFDFLYYHIFSYNNLYKVEENLYYLIELKKSLWLGKSGTHIW